MGVASHLGIRIDEYDARIRTFIPRYETMLDEAADTLRGLRTRAPVILVASLESSALLEEALDAASAELLAAEARLRNAAAEAERASSLVERRVISTEDYEARITARLEAAAAADAARARRRAAELDLEFTRVTAPIDGRVSDRRVSVGNLVSGGTENHLMLVDVTTLGIGGKLATETLEKCGITVNMNMIPFDTRKPMDPSGVRIGTPALTTRGMGTDEMRQIGRWILAALKSPTDSDALARIRAEVSSLCEQFPVPAAVLAGA